MTLLSFTYHYYLIKSSNAGKAWIQEYKKLSLFFAARLTFEQAKGDEVSCMTEAELATAKLLQSDNRPTNLCSHSSLFSLPSFAGLHKSPDMKPIHSLARGGEAE